MIPHSRWHWRHLWRCTKTELVMYDAFYDFVCIRPGCAATKTTTEGGVW